MLPKRIKRPSDSSSTRDWLTIREFTEYQYTVALIAAQSVLEDRYAELWHKDETHAKYAGFIFTEMPRCYRKPDRPTVTPLWRTQKVVQEENDLKDYDTSDESLTEDMAPPYAFKGKSDQVVALFAKIKIECTLHIPNTPALRLVTHARHM
jgi:hypothetical protein